MRFLRILPEVWARTSCSLSNFTRNMAFGRSSVTVPGNSIMSSLGIHPPYPKNRAPKCESGPSGPSQIQRFKGRERLERGLCDQKARPNPSIHIQVAPGKQIEDLLL